ncbi:MAG TPA: DNA repair protein RecN [Acidimicrobiales bacterium]|nr:DNA repair protein RecN [Acidimicrobiales bacterium]
MITELRVRELGVIEDVNLVLGGGLTVITGETGAGKTLVVEALQLLLGARADPTVVRAGATECRVEGRFESGNGEVVLARVIPSDGRSRAYIDDRMTPVSALDEVGRDLVDLHGQRDHQSLLRPTVQRAALDQFAGVDLSPLLGLRAELQILDARIEALGGDDATRARRLDLLRYESEEIESHCVADPDEIDSLALEEERLGSAVALREAATSAHDLLAGEGAASDLLGRAIESLGHIDLLSTHAARLRGLIAEVDDLAAELRTEAERAEEDPERLAFVQDRRSALNRLVRKHGGSLRDVLRVYEEANREIADLSAADETREAVEVERDAVLVALRAAESLVGDQRRRAARPLSASVAAHFHDLALRHASLSVVVPAEGIGDEIEFSFRANPGEGSLPLARVASGGELARVMLALRLVLSSAPPTLVFDEVDAGIGGGVGLAVGSALAKLAFDRQVLVVTHLAQVAAFADHHLVVEKETIGGRTRSSVRRLEPSERVIELSRMLSGQPDSSSAREHASELLALAGGIERGSRIHT